MSIKKIIKNIIPFQFLIFFKKILNWIEKRKFYGLKKPEVKSNNLLSINEVNLSYILNDNHILNT